MGFYKNKLTEARFQSNEASGFGFSVLPKDSSRGHDAMFPDKASGAGKLNPEILKSTYTCRSHAPESSLYIPEP